MRLHRKHALSFLMPVQHPVQAAGFQFPLLCQGREMSFPRFATASSFFDR